MHGVLSKQDCATSTGEVSECVRVALGCFRGTAGNDVAVSPDKLLDVSGSIVAGQLKFFKEHTTPANKAGPERLRFTCGRPDDTGLVMDIPETSSAETIDVADGTDTPDEPEKNGRGASEGTAVDTGNADADVGETIFTVEGVCPWKEDDIDKLTGTESDSEISDQVS